MHQLLLAQRRQRGCHLASADQRIAKATFATDIGATGPPALDSERRDHDMATGSQGEYLAGEDNMVPPASTITPSG